MAFGKRRHVEMEILDLVRAELAAVRAEMQTTIAESIAMLSTRVRSEVEARMGEPSALVAGMQDIRHGMTSRDAELATVLRQVASTCEVLAERVHLDRIERTALVDAVSRLTTTLAITGTLPAAPSRPTVIGGTVDPEQSTAKVPAIIPDETDTEIDLEAEARRGDATPASRSTTARATTAPAPVPATPPPTPPAPAPTPVPAAAINRSLPPDGVEVRCRFGDRWVTGFEVCEVIRFDDVTRYRLRRRSDGSVLPTLFEEKDLRFFTTSFIDH